MADVYKKLAKLTPSDDREYVLYSADTNTSSLVSNITVVNRGGAAEQFSIYSDQNIVQGNLADVDVSAYILQENDIIYTTTDFASYTTNQDVSAILYNRGAAIVTSPTTNIEYFVVGTNGSDVQYAPLEDMLSFSVLGSIQSQGTNSVSANDAGIIVVTDDFTWSSVWVAYIDDLTSGFSSVNLPTVPTSWNNTFVVSSNNHFIAVDDSGETGYAAWSSNGTVWTLSNMQYYGFFDNATNAISQDCAAFITSSTVSYTFDGGMSWFGNNTLAAIIAPPISAAVSTNINSVVTAAVLSNSNTINMTTSDNFFFDSFTTYTLPAPNSEVWGKVIFDPLIEKFLIFNSADNPTTYLESNSVNPASASDWTVKSFSSAAIGNVLSTSTVIPYTGSAKFVTSSSNALYKDASISAGDTQILEPGVIASSGDTIIFSGSSNLSVSMYGTETDEVNKYSKLGQLQPNANTATSLYFANGNDVLVRSILITNVSSSAETVDLAITDGAIGGVENADYILKDYTIGANQTVVIKAGYTMNGDNEIYIKSTNGNATFTAFGAELAASIGGA